MVFKRDKVAVKCEDCGKEIMAERKSRNNTYKRCVVCIDDYLTRRDFERRIEKGDYQ